MFSVAKNYKFTLAFGGLY